MKSQTELLTMLQERQSKLTKLLHTRACIDIELLQRCKQLRACLDASEEHLITEIALLETILGD